MSDATHLRTSAPFDGAALLRFLAARAIPGVEVVADGAYSRTVALPSGPAVLTVTPDASGVTLHARLADAADQPKAIALVRHLFGLDQDPAPAIATLGEDPALAPLIAQRPGLRVPGTVSGFELSLRAVLGQQISVAAARTLAGRITAQLGAALPPELASGGALTHLLPTPAAIAAAPADVFPMPRSRIRTIQGLAAADPRLDAPADADALTELWGVGAWTAGYVRMRLGDPDVFLPTDVAILKALRNLGLTEADAPRWAPVRSFATLHLWASLANA
ncbi:DNA-3-methyladenine glycosylase family protein [Conexibacter woesei]|uniref:DNA-3-methyladenine glycosylase family protein n=1 Tax=Conexibacter woesei TaxID=191495 RepID=UPI000428190B|nr:AlkA N-terminal domain-containing protein [Conexibacter woesei]